MAIVRRIVFLLAGGILPAAAPWPVLIVEAPQPPPRTAVIGAPTLVLAFWIPVPGGTKKLPTYLVGGLEGAARPGEPFRFCTFGAPRAEAHYHPGRIAELEALLERRRDEAGLAVTVETRVDVPGLEGREVAFHRTQTLPAAEVREILARLRTGGLRLRWEGEAGRFEGLGDLGGQG